MMAESTKSERDRLVPVLECGLTSLKIDTSQAIRNALLDYLELLEKWNRVHNLTAIRTAEAMVSTHLLDSLSVLPYLPRGELLDVGTGGGLPGIPLALVNGQLSVTLIESNQKKAAFLRQAVGELAIPNATVVCENVNQWHSPRKFACIISRAFAEISKFIASSRHLLAGGGIFAAMKGRYPDEEIKSIPEGFVLKQAIELNVPGLNAARHLLIIGRA